METLELKDNMIFKITKSSNGRIFHAYSDGKEYTNEIPAKLREEAYKLSVYIIYDETTKQFKLKEKGFVPVLELPQELDLDFIHSSYQYKPDNIIISEVKWKLLIRNILKSKNIMMTGHSGAGKTVTAKSAALVLNRPFFKFNMGAMQDPRASLIGNTFFNTNAGTYFSESEFVKAIRTPNAVILLDELTRAHPDANNILITVLDPTQRYLRLDEKDGQEIIEIAEGVSFIATANIGNEYTGTRVLDRATIDRFSIIEVEMLNEEQELTLLKMEFTEVEDQLLELLVAVSSAVREEFLNEEGKISTMMSTRAVKEAAELLSDRFTIAEALEVTLLPLYDEQGGSSSERQVIRTIIDGIVPKSDELNKKLFESGISEDNPFMQGLKNNI